MGDELVKIRKLSLNYMYFSRIIKPVYLDGYIGCSGKVKEGVPKDVHRFGTDFTHLG